MKSKRAQAESSRKELMAGIKRVVVKVGTYLLTGGQTGLDEKLIRGLVSQLASLRGDGYEVLLVTSGAIGAGTLELGLKKRPDTLPGLQAAAAVGQTALMHLYRELFAARGRRVGQILLTREDMDHRVRHLNARHTIEALLEMGVIPIVNENDTVAVEEIKFCDNDFLAAQLSNLIQADLMVILTDVDGLLRPGEGETSCWKLVSRVEKVDEEVFRLAGAETREYSRGGMRGKLEAAAVVTRAGGMAVIAHGRRGGVLNEILRGEDVGTLFTSPFARLRRRKCWIAFARVRRGWIVADPGARRALAEKGRSLLASGIVAVEGQFGVGDMVGIRDSETEEEFARGLVNYASEEIALIKGRKTSEITGILGSRDYDEIVHRDNLLVL